MSANVPTIQGPLTAPQVINLPRGLRQMRIQNLDATNSITVAWNGSGGAWTLIAGDALGIGLFGGITTVTVGGTGSFQIMLQG